MFCAIKSCKTTSSNGDIFNFPEESSMRNKWLEACRLRSHDVSPNLGLCHIHFKGDQIETDISTGFPRPSPGVVPSLYLETDSTVSAPHENRLSFFESKKNEVDLENVIQEQVTTLLETNIRYRRKIIPLLKKLSDSEKYRLRKYTSATEQKTVVDQMNRVSYFEQQKVNKTVDFDEAGFVVRKNDVAISKNHPFIPPETSSFNERITNLMDKIEAVKLAQSVVTAVENPNNRANSISS